MKQFIRWLEIKLPRREAAADELSNLESAEPDDIDLGMGRPKDMQEPAENVPMPDVNDDELTITSPDVDFALDTGEPKGFDPYDTAKMLKK